MLQLPSIGRLDCPWIAAGSARRSSESRWGRSRLAFALAILIAWVLSLNPRVWEINDHLEQDAKIAAYPFPFRVLELDNGVAVVASPRSTQVPVMRFLRIVDPRLRNAESDSPTALAVQKTLGQIQGRVRELSEAEA